MVFAAWLLAWMMLISGLLMEHAWESSAKFRVGAMPPPPFRKLLFYAAGTIGIAAAMFAILPRLAFGLRPQFLPALTWGSSQAGLSDHLDLGSLGPLSSNPEVVMRIVPKGELEKRLDLAEERLALLRGFALESFDGRTWNPRDATPPVKYVRMLGREEESYRPFLLETYLSPSQMGVVPLPYGLTSIGGANPMFLQVGPGGSLRMRFPSRQVMALPMGLERKESYGIPEEYLTSNRRKLLTYPGDATEFADRWSRQVVPEDVPGSELARRLGTRLRTFRYTLENPSAKEVDPLRDFLERTHAGHCEYFASALAIMLRHRGVPARVVTGYRLGPWISDGGYFLVTQNEAHSWVEFYDPAVLAWRVADPTPPAPPGMFLDAGMLATLQRWVDVFSFRWDRYVVRFSDADQVAGLEWFRNRTESLNAPGMPSIRWRLPLVLILLGYLLWRSRHYRILLPWAAMGHLPQLGPLLRRTARHIPPRTGDTVRTWLDRLATTRPERQDALKHLAAEAEAVAYSDRSPAELKSLVKQERAAWKGWKHHQSS
jgi:hypothetical protein